jgi:hypothetical protein
MNHLTRLNLIGLNLCFLILNNGIWFCFCRPATRVLKKKKLKINVHRPVGTRVVFDEEGNTLPPLARVADRKNVDNSSLLDQGNFS